MSNSPGEKTSPREFPFMVLFLLRIEAPYTINLSSFFAIQPWIQSCPHTQQTPTTRIAAEAVTQSRADGLSFSDGLEDDPGLSGFCCFCRSCCCFCSSFCCCCSCLRSNCCSCCCCLRCVSCCFR